MAKSAVRAFRDTEGNIWVRVFCDSYVVLDDEVIDELRDTQYAVSLNELRTTTESLTEI
jgi:hypothetical protein